MYKFLSRQDNFIAMQKSIDLYPMVKDTLLNDFWQLAHSKLKELIAESQGKWLCSISKDIIKDEWPKLYMYKPDWKIDSKELPEIFIGMERMMQSFPYYGLWYDSDSELFDQDRFLKLIRDSEFYANMDFEDDEDYWWAFWKNAGPQLYNLDQPKSLVRITEEHREDTAIISAKLIYSLAMDLEGDLDRIMKEVIY